MNSDTKRNTGTDDNSPSVTTARPHQASDSATAAPEEEKKRVATEGIVRIRARDLMQGQREAILELDGKDYRLRVTASGKLILTK
jgi:hemin uptake protein HemP